MSLNNVKIGNKAPEIVNVIIEIPRGSHNKYEIDKDSGLIMLDRVSYVSMHHPLDYGYIPETLCEDNDPLDVLVLGSDPVPPLCIVRVRPIAMLEMIDDGEQDNKLLGVQADNPRYDTIKTLSDIQFANPHLLKEISHFFFSYKQLQNKIVETKQWYDAKRAKEEIIRTQKMHKEA